MSQEHRSSADRPPFSLATTVALLVGVALACIEFASPGFSAAGVAAVTTLAGFVVLFGRDWLRWLVRDHERNR